MIKDPSTFADKQGQSNTAYATDQTKEEKDVKNIVSEGAAQTNMVPALEIKGKVIALEVPANVNFGNQVERIVEETKTQPTTAPKKKPFIPPLTGAKNLGFSTLMNKDGKTQEELDVEATVNQGKQPVKPVISAKPTSPADRAQTINSQRTDENQIYTQTAPVEKKKPFIPPLLGAKNLGMSTLV